MSSRALTDEEVAERVAILKRFRELLSGQREKFRRYLDVLDREKDDIVNDDVDRLVQHVELEEAIVSEIFTFQKVIDPLEEMYREAYHGKEPEDIPDLRAKLEHMKTEVLKQSEENRDLLKQHMTMLRNEVLSLRNPAKKFNSVYGAGDTHSVIDVKG